METQRRASIVGRINGNYGEAAWTPIRYVNRAHSRTALAGLYRAARAALVTPLRDGMNLVAKEYVAAQDPDDPGVLILSRFAGAALECKPALLVNPYDPDAVGAAILRALSMPLDERRARQAALMQILAKNDIQDWPDKFLDDAYRAAGRPAARERRGAARVIRPGMAGGRQPRTGRPSISERLPQ